jgi:ABC-type branched-subunit amino acid transport system substrate-binding protein
MMKTKMNTKRLVLYVAALVMALMGGSALADGPGQRPLTDQEKRGKQIYLRGESDSGKEITAYLGDGATELPATAMACVNCHGFDGRGRPEGGVIPSDIRWELLTKSYGVTHPTGRKHPPYTDRALELSITKGFDPAGNRLPDAMPRYWMSSDDLSALVAYMKLLGKEQDPGLTQTSVRIGTIVPSQGHLREMGMAVKAALGAYFAEVNARGGVFNRKLELRAVESAGSAPATKAALDQLADRDRVFAVAAPFISGAEKEVREAAEEKELLMVGPSTPYPETGFPMPRYIFYIFSGLKEQAMALVNFTSDSFGKEQLKIAVIHSESENFAAAASAVAEQCKKRGLDRLIKIGYAPGKLDVARTASELSGAGFNTILFLAPGEDAVQLMKEAARLNWTPRVLVPGSLVSKSILEAPPAFKERLFLSFPTLPSDQARDAVTEYMSLAEKYRLPAGYQAAQLSALCAAKVLVEGLKLSGKEVSREKLITMLEGFYNFETGLAPPLTFGPNRRVGALGAYIVSIDPANREFKPASNWVAIE